MQDYENKEIEMVISARFRHRGFTPEKYDEAIRRLEETGHGVPAGRLHHVAVEADGEVEVYDVWGSEEALRRLGTFWVVNIRQRGDRTPAFVDD
jgi:hypothetical protein